MPKLIDLSGQRFGRLTVISFAGIDKFGNKTWFCRCDCGKEKIISRGHLKKGDAQSCGCLKSEITTKRNIKHGYVGTKLYNVYHNMKERCLNPSRNDYSRYGGRGICVCEEWKEDFKTFQKWAFENGYKDNLTIDRIDVNGNYEPSNCRWVDGITQANNKRNSYYVEYNGKKLTISEWARETGISPSLIRYRLNKGWPIERALTETPHK